MATDNKTQSSKPETKLFFHGSQPVFVLVPTDELDQRPCQDAFETEFAQLETPPRVVKELRVGRLPSNAVVYVTHPYSVRERTESGSYEITHKVHISAPLELKQFTLTNHDDDGLGLVNVPAITDAIQGLCRNTRTGRVYRAQLSADKDWSLKTVKLLNS